MSTDTRASGGEPVLELQGPVEELRRPARRARRHAQDHARRPQGHHRSERRRQDHAVQSDHRNISRRRRARCCCSAGTSPAWPSHRRTALGMARTFQITSLFPKLTVLDNVLLAIQGPAAVEIRDVAVHVVVSRRLRQGARAAGARPLHGPQGHRGPLPVARRAAPARDRAWPRQRPENPAARRAGRRPVVRRIRRDGGVPAWGSTPIWRSC